MATRFELILTSLITAMVCFSSATARAQHEIGAKIIRQNCMDCHRGDSAEADLDLEKLLKQSPLVRNLKMWRNIAKRIEFGDMPPPDDGSLNRDQKQRFAKWYGQSIEKFDYQSIADPGYEPVRRLLKKTFIKFPID